MTALRIANAGSLSVSVSSWVPARLSRLSQPWTLCARRLLTFSLLRCPTERCRKTTSTKCQATSPRAEICHLWESCTFLVDFLNDSIGTGKCAQQRRLDANVLVHCLISQGVYMVEGDASYRLTCLVCYQLFVGWLSATRKTTSLYASQPSTTRNWLAIESALMGKCRGWICVDATLSIPTRSPEWCSLRAWKENWCVVTIATNNGLHLSACRSSMCVKQKRQEKWGILENSFTKAESACHSSFVFKCMCVCGGGGGVCVCRGEGGGATRCGTSVHTCACAF